jgi:hypothetical protein
VDRTGAVKTVPIPPAGYSTPRLSPDGQRIAFHIEAEKNDVWVYDIARGRRRASWSDTITFQSGPRMESV